MHQIGAYVVCVVSKCTAERQVKLQHKELETSQCSLDNSLHNRMHNSLSYDFVLKLYGILARYRSANIAEKI